jgi:hypothetical protein
VRVGDELLSELVRDSTGMVLGPILPAGTGGVPAATAPSGLGANVLRRAQSLCLAATRCCFVRLFAPQRPLVVDDSRAFGIASPPRVRGGR